MKFYKYYFLSLAFVTVAMTGCKEADIDNEHHYDNKLYISSQPICDDLLIKESITEASRSIAYRIASPAEEDIQIDFEAAPAMTASYNLIYGDNATALAADYYDIPKKTATIKTGDISSDDIVVNFKNTNELDDSKRYVLPVTITGASKMAILGSHRTAYFVFKGAALINVVANIKKLYFPIKWKSNVSSMSTITIEALLRSDDWVAGRDNALSSVFGIEGSFLVRVGDGDRPRDQVQVVAPGGNFPEANAVPGLPVNEWVHIAIVYADIPLILNKSSVLLSLTNKFDTSGPKGFMTTKFFESLAVEKPILCVQSDEAYLAEAIKETHSGLAATRVDEVYDFLKHYYEEWQEKGYTTSPVNRDKLSNYSRKEQASQFERIFEEI